MAMERLGQLRTEAVADDSWDLIVVDTPPSRSALDFLDAPQRLGSFLDGRFIRLLTAPARAGGRLGMRAVGVGMSIAGATLGKLLGQQFLLDLSTFVAAMDTVFGGFRARADETYRLLQDPGTRFVVVAAPERDALREAGFFVNRLARDKMPLAGLVLNRVAVSRARISADRARDAAESLEESGDRHTAAVLRVHADQAETAARHRRLIRDVAAANPRLATVQVPLAGGDIADLPALRSVAEALTTP